MRFDRRVKFTIVILASQLLLIALALTWFIQLFVIARYGSVRFIENNPVILITELIVAGLICIFSTVVFALQILKLGEKRRTDDREPR